MRSKQINKIELGNKITKLAGYAIEGGDKQKCASNMLKLAKELVDAKPSAELEKKIDDMGK